MKGQARPRDRPVGGTGTSGGQPRRKGRVNSAVVTARRSHRSRALSRAHTRPIAREGDTVAHSSPLRPGMTFLPGAVRPDRHAAPAQPRPPSGLLPSCGDAGCCRRTVSGWPLSGREWPGRGRGRRCPWPFRCRRARTSRMRCRRRPGRRASPAHNHFDGVTPGRRQRELLPRHGPPVEPDLPDSALDPVGVAETDAVFRTAEDAGD